MQRSPDIEWILTSTVLKNTKALNLPSIIHLVLQSSEHVPL
jgi:hypothetical protein